MLEEVKPEYLVTKNANYHTLHSLPIVLRIKNLAGLQESWWCLNSHLPTAHCLYSNTLFFHSLNRPHTLFFRVLEHADPSICSQPVFHEDYFFMSQLGCHFYPEIFLAPPPPQPRSASFVLCMQRTVFFSFRALIWTFNYQPTGVIRWWMSVFLVLTPRSMSVPKENSVCFAHHCRQHPTWCFKHGRSSMTLDWMNEGEGSWNA